ncbi:hypothetical protein EAF04_002162 [Stromatinia cepivora]|nr:hypothetical protein EAF04_002162 [Stromatinia cepivora]
MIAKLVSDQSFKPAYTKEKATRLYQLCYRKYSRGYVRASTEKTLYKADQCFWRQFWPAEEFPGERAWIARIEKDGEAPEKDETTVGKIKQKVKQAETRNRQNETIESPWPQPLFKPDEPPKIIKPREQSRPGHDIADRGRTNTTKHQRQLKQNLSNKKARAKRAARALAKHSSKAYTSSEHQKTLQKELERALLISSTQLQHASPASGLVVTSSQTEDSNIHRESGHSSQLVQPLPASSPVRLQTLDEMIEEEREIARQLCVVHESALDPENRSIRQSRDGLEFANGVKGASDRQRRFCLVL